MNTSKEQLQKMLDEKEKYLETCKTELIATSGQINLLKQLLIEKEEIK